MAVAQLTPLTVPPEDGAMVRTRLEIEDMEAAVIDAAFAFMRWADTDVDLSALPAEALRLLEKTEALGRAYDPHGG